MDRPIRLVAAAIITLVAGVALVAVVFATAVLIASIAFLRRLAR